MANSLISYPITPAIRFLREHKIAFEAHAYEYVEKGGTKHSAESLRVDEHSIIKTLVLETNEKKPLIVLQHGDLQVSTKELARILRVKNISPVSPEKAQRLTGYLVGGTSPFGLKTEMPIYAEATIFTLDKIFINGGKRGFLVEILSAQLKNSLPILEVGVAV